MKNIRERRGAFAVFCVSGPGISRLYAAKIKHKKGSKNMKWLDEHLEETIMMVFLAGITIIFSYAIIMRYLFNNAPSWAEEISRMMFVWSSFLSIGLTIRRQSAIRIDALLSALPHKGKCILQILVHAFLIAVFVYWFRGGVHVVQTLIANGQTSPALLIPMWIVYSCTVVGFGLGIIRCIQQIIFNLKALSKEAA